MSDKNNDLITQISEQDKITFLKVLVALGKIDDHFDDNEKKLIVDSAVMFGIPFEKTCSIFENDSPKEILDQVAQIKDRRLALALIKETCLIANSDGDMSDQEIVFIGKIGKAMGIELEKIEQISQWVIDYLSLQQQEKIIFEKP